ncbi:MAG: hypothetical protein FWE80_01040 [Oscillospiraceae bacterium]|nr:hypothetical protein [Oscillospiraceae bacterium]
MNDWKKMENPLENQQTVEDLLAELERELSVASSDNDLEKSEKWDDDSLLAGSAAADPAATGKRQRPTRAARTGRPIRSVEEDQPDTPDDRDELESFSGEEFSGEDISIVRSASRYTRHGHRRGRYKFAAPLGLLMILLTIAGAVSLVFFGVSAVVRNNSRRSAELREQIEYTLKPLMLLTPNAFESAGDTEESTLLQAAIDKLTVADMIKKQQGKEDTYLHDLNDRMIIPLKEVEDSFASLFGNAAKPKHHTFSEEAGDYYAYEYDEKNSCYYAPYGMYDAMYYPVMDTISRSGDKYLVRVGYVRQPDIQINDLGEEIITPAQATYFQIYTVQQTEIGNVIILAVADED